uniref:Uncharacterized protein n=1 Tax=Lotus japonicus TaxID=34305 RepID=I3SB22_LOTJA|nr:unknown [Lotus japonicus]
MQICLHGKLHLMMRNWTIALLASHDDQASSFVENLKALTCLLFLCYVTLVDLDYVFMLYICVEDGKVDLRDMFKGFWCSTEGVV